MRARRGAGGVPSLPLLLLLVAVWVAGSGGQQQEELPHAAAHKQIVYRYIPIDKSFLSLDRAYDDYYKTSPVSENARRDYGPPSSTGRLDSYDQLYNKDYRTRKDYSDYFSSGTGSRGSSAEVDTYSSYSRADGHQHGISGTHSLNTYDYGDDYDYDYSQEYTTKRPKRRHKVKKKSKSTSTRVLDFAEDMIRR